MSKGLTFSLAHAMAKAGLCGKPDPERETLRDILKHDHFFEWKRLETRTHAEEHKAKDLKERAMAAHRRIEMKAAAKERFTKHGEN